MINSTKTASRQSQSRVPSNIVALKPKAKKKGISTTRPGGDVPIAVVLEQLERFIREIIWLPNDADYAVVVMWALTTHVFDRFNHTPRLSAWSPVPGCGKTTLLQILEKVAQRGFMWVIPTEATIFRYIEQERPTLFLDEMDKYLYNSQAVLALLNAGHMRGGAVPRVVGEGEDMKVKLFKVFAPMAFGIKAKHLPSDLAERSIRIVLRKAPKQMVKYDAHEHEPVLQLLRNGMAAWASKALPHLKAAPVPSALLNRSGDNWRPLLSVARAVGGDWYQRIEAAALAYDKAHVSTDRGLVLLRNIKEVWPDGMDFMTSDKLISALTEREDWPWSEMHPTGKPLSKKGLASMLEPFEIAPKQKNEKVKLQEVPEHWGKLRGYWRKPFEPVWATYTPEESAP